MHEREWKLINNTTLNIEQTVLSRLKFHAFSLKTHKTVWGQKLIIKKFQLGK